MKDWKTYAIIILAIAVGYLCATRPPETIVRETVREVGCIDEDARFLIGGILNDCMGYDYFVSLSHDSAIALFNESSRYSKDESRGSYFLWADEGKIRTKEKIVGMIKELRGKRANGVSDDKRCVNGDKTIIFDPKNRK